MSTPDRLPVWDSGQRPENRGRAARQIREAGAALDRQDSLVRRGARDSNGNKSPFLLIQEAEGLADPDAEHDGNSIEQDRTELMDYAIDFVRRHHGAESLASWLADESTTLEDVRALLTALAEEAEADEDPRSDRESR